MDKIEYPELDQAIPKGSPIFGERFDLISQAEIEVQVRVGSGKISLQEFFDMKKGSVIKLEESVTEPVDVMVNGQVIARGELCAVGDNFGVNITEVSED